MHIFLMAKEVYLKLLYKRIVHLLEGVDCGLRLFLNQLSFDT